MAVVISSVSDRRHRRHSSGGGHSHNPSCASIMFAILVGALISIPFILLGPMNLVLSVIISRREGHRTGARSAFGLNRHHTTKSKQEMQPDFATRIVGGDAAQGVRDLCLSMAVGISPAQLVAFVASFREVAPGAELVLFFEAPLSARFADIVDKFDVGAFPVDKEQLEPVVIRGYHPSTVRWIYFQRFLDAVGSRYERVLMVDADQTFFQDDPFGIIADPGIYTFEDDQLIRDSRQHSKKIQDCLGAAAFAQIADKPALHSAVCLATSSLAVDHARQMSQALLSPPFQACEAAGVDTGLHEYLIYSRGVKGELRFDQASGPVMDIQGGKYEMSDSRILDLSGRKVPVVYRYLQNEVARTDIFNRYIYWAEEDVGAVASAGTPVAAARPGAPKAAPVAVADEKSTAPATPRTVVVASCPQYSLSEGVDLFKAKCDLAQKKVASMSGCCAACSTHRACRAFSYDNDNGMCYMKHCDRALAPGPSNTLKSITSGRKTEPASEGRTTR